MLEVMATSRDRDAIEASGEYGLGARGLPRQWRWLLPVAVLASATAWLAGVASGRLEGGARATLMVAGALFTAVAAGVPLWQQARTARSRADAVTSARVARAQMRIAIEDALDPLTAILVQLAAARGVERTRLRGEAVQVALTTVAHLSAFAGPEGLSGPRRVRVCLFAVEPGPPRRLVPQSYAGRAGAPSVAFDDGTRSGQALFRIVDDGWQVVDDTGGERATPWWDEQHAYRSYAAGPVPGPDGSPVALMTLDALEPGELTGLDVPLIRLIAHLLSLAYQL
jgi:ABC-type amino acid transport substrate-binding protein